MKAELKVVVLAKTENFEQNIARGAKLCYSSADIETLRDKVTEEEAERFLNMILKLGHGSVLEHSSITFAIEGVSRSVSHQLVRHRIASYSQQSQRYVKEAQFEYVVPKAIQGNIEAEKTYIRHMERTQEAYNRITEELLYEKISKHIETLNEGEFNKLLFQEQESNGKYVLTQEEVCQLFKQYDKRTYSRLEKIAIENARYVLPNACETKIQVTMNVRALFNFFTERMCDRAQEEIRELAWAMWKACMEISPTIFQYAAPSCVRGKCKEAQMSCGKMKEYTARHKEVVLEYMGGKNE